MIAQAMGFSRSEIIELFYAALLHDIGISDEHIKKDEYAVEMGRHCNRGYTILKKLPISPNIPYMVRLHHETWIGSGPFKKSGDEIPLAAELIGMTSMFDDVFGKVRTFDHAAFLRAKEWAVFHQRTFRGELITALKRLLEEEHYLLNYFNHETKYLLNFPLEEGEDIFYGMEEIEQFAYCFADLIDQRSSFTFNHSVGLSRLARAAAIYLGYDEHTQNTMLIAGLLHDIGKLCVSPDILHKNGPLSPSERFEMNKHTYYTRKVLEQISGFEEIVDIAANHHERLDGVGYPYHLPAEKLGELERVMAICDVYQALTEDRPYRKGMPPDQAWRIINEMAERRHLDADLVKKLIAQE